jgi:hypothetical protein
MKDNFNASPLKSGMDGFFACIMISV